MLNHLKWNRSLKNNDWDCPIPFYTATYVPDYFDTKADCGK